MNGPSARQRSAEAAAAGDHGSASADRFSRRVRRSFGRGAPRYEGEARLQQAIAWRLAHLAADLPLPPGACADLGAGTGLLSRALIAHARGLAARPPLQLDLCPELLARNPLARRPAGGLVWDLNSGLPQGLGDAALLASSFALQWLEHPAEQLERWCQSLAPGGWLLLAVPTAGSFPQWHQACARAEVPCTALPLPEADSLLRVALAGRLSLRHGQVLRFSRPDQGGLPTLRHVQRLGAGASRRRPLSTAELRRLLAHWPASSPLTWEVLLLIGQRRG